MPPPAARNWVPHAVQAYTRAVEYYPNSGMLHAQLAWACHVTGGEEEARRHAEEALRLDALMPHAELKLAQPTVVARLPGRLAAEQRPRHDGRRTPNN